MTYFLTSSTCKDGESFLDEANGFARELRTAFPNPCAALCICSDPEDHEKADRYAGFTRENFEAGGIRFSSFRLLDGRNADQAGALVHSAELIVLMGGHVPTQNRFFARIGLRELLKGYEGVIVGISAGTMNSAETVYAQPELEGEAVSREYVRFLPGLGLTEVMVLPHYQKIKDDVLDGLRLFEDITYPDSMGRRFFALPDGSYLFGRDGHEELRGDAWLIQDGHMEKVCSEGESLTLK